MKVEQWRCDGDFWSAREPSLPDADLVLLFGHGDVLADPGRLGALRERFPTALLAGCTTAGEIHDTEVSDGGLVATAIGFAGSRVHSARVVVAEPAASRGAGRELAAALPAAGLVHAFVLADGLHVNGSQLVEGLLEGLPAGVTVTGGLAADGDRFRETFVALGRPGETPTCEPRSVVALGFYGGGLAVGYGSLGGWDSFGPERLVTRSRDNVLYELDGRSALELYQRYLGEHADGLPASGLLFPLSVRGPALGGEPVVRTLLAVDRDEKSLTFAGDVPEGSYARLMKANFDRLIDGAVGAARTAASLRGPADLALLISCVGRRLVLAQRIEEEIEGVREVLGSRPVLAGFYSYGEISPLSAETRCALHNQTMTITTLAEG